MDVGFDGRRVLVVGASSGIGRAIASHAVGMGAAVAFAGRRKHLLDEAVAAAGGGHAVVGDVARPEQCEEIVAQAVRALGGLDALVFCVGAGRLARLAAATADDWYHQLHTNVVGPSLVIRAAVPHLQERAVVAVLSSESVGMPYPGLGPYSSSKAALEESIRVWRLEQPNLRFCCIRVGATNGTDFARDFDVEVAGQLFPTWVALGRLPAQNMDPDELGGTIARVLAVVASSPGVDCQDVTIRPPGGLFLGDVDFMMQAIDDAAGNR